NGPADINTHLHLLKYDSVHGIFNKTIKAEGDYIVIDNHRMRLTRYKDINDLDWSGIDIVLECSGKFNKKSEAAKHLNHGAKKVLVSAPCDEADATIVYKVNDHTLKDEHKVVSIGSCTTNCLAPVAKVINDKIGIESGF